MYTFLFTESTKYNYFHIEYELGLYSQQHKTGEKYNIDCVKLHYYTVYTMYMDKDRIDNEKYFCKV